jgi:hypothetical protein
VDVTIHWEQITGNDDPKWGWSRVLYAYSWRRELLYIGKAHNCTVAKRWDGADKLDGFWRDLERERSIYKHTVLVGNLALVKGARLTRELLADVESLLIIHHQPWGNIQSTRSRPIFRRGLRLRNIGHWPGARAVVDRG